MKKIIVFTFLVLLTSCSSKITQSITKHYTPLDASTKVDVLGEAAELPKNAELLGEIKIGDSGFTTDCDYETIIAQAKTAARKVGGNAVKIIKHSTPDLWSSCHRITANIFRIDDFTNIISNNNIDTTQNILTEIDEISKMLVIGKGSKIANSKGILLSRNDVDDILSKYPDLQNKFNRGIQNSKTAIVFGYISGSCIGFGIGGILANVIMRKEIKPYNYYVMGAGAVFIIPAITLEFTGRNKIKKSINSYNNLQKNNYQSYLNFGLNSNGIGFYITF